MEALTLDTCLPDEHVAALVAVFGGPRWLTAPAGMRLIRPIRMKYWLLWSGQASTVDAELLAPYRRQDTVLVEVNAS